MSDGWESSLVVTDRMHEAFVRLSGDSNPLHTDPVAARRLPFGRVAVHGVHLALHALEHLAAHDHRVPLHVHCTFRRSVAPGDAVTLRLETRSATEVDVVVEHDVWPVARLRVRLGERAAPAHETDSIPSPAAADPAVLGPADVAAAHGVVAVEADVRAARVRFPHLTALVGERCLAELITLTRLVGMHVPGLHSLLSSFDVDLGRFGEPSDGLTYSVVRYDDRFAKATLDVRASSLRGSVTAFVRSAPVEASIGGTTPLPHEFAGQRWLVVGGSRGLGAIAAMLLAAGGADVRLTYRLGAADAEQLAARIGATAHRLDVTDPGRAALTEVLTGEWAPTHLAYFASPPIFAGAPGTYSERLEQRFTAVYVDAFEALVGHLDPGMLTGVLWPSSEAVEVEVPGLAEYTTVKRRGEAICRSLAERYDALIVSTPRLPRLRTDQTASFLPIDVDDAPTTMLRALRAFSG